MIAFALAIAVTLSAAPDAPKASAPSKKTQLKINVTPESAVVYVDGKRKGTGKAEIKLAVTPGNHRIKIVRNKDSHEEMVRVKKGETLVWKWEFDDGTP